MPKKQMLKGMCPMHCELLHMLERFPDVGHYCKMDNLFIGVDLAWEAYLLQTQVLVHGVVLKLNHSFPTWLIQEEKARKAAERVQGTVKAAVLKNDGKSCVLIIASCSFYILSHSIKEITWIEDEKKAYSPALKKAITFKVLCFNLSHNYNFEMNDDDMLDQLQLVYHFMRFQQNIKRWWALWLWGMEVLLINDTRCIAGICNLFY